MCPVHLVVPQKEEEKFNTRCVRRRVRRAERGGKSAAGKQEKRERKGPLRLRHRRILKSFFHRPTTRQEMSWRPLLTARKIIKLANCGNEAAMGRYFYDVCKIPHPQTCFVRSIGGQISPSQGRHHISMATRFRPFVNLRI